MRSGATLICRMAPGRNEELINELANRGITGLAMDAVPRISRAQSMDVLSSMANIAGYRAVIEAANAFGRLFTGQVTAAGKVPPAKVYVIGAGDRKSTRLNSSHVSISYAVFCLKKKKINSDTKIKQEKRTPETNPSDLSSHS